MACCASGKTTLAGELVPLVQSGRRQVLLAGLDAYKIPWDQRDPADRDSGEGLYRKAWQLDVIHEHVLLPLGPGGTRECLFRDIDVDDRRVPEHRQVADQDAVTIVDGVFALRPELNDCWDFRVYMDVGVEHTLERGPVRGLAKEGTWRRSRWATTRDTSRRRRSICAKVDPLSLADVIVDNRDVRAPKLLWRNDFQGSGLG